MADRIQLRRDTKANWVQYNPILLEGEPGIELDTDQWKLGDGIHPWSQLSYRGGEVVQQRGQSTTVAMSQKALTDELNLITVFDISAYNLTNNQPTKYANLVAALGTNGANIPESYRMGGMTVKYIQSSDNKYVQYRLMSNIFNTTVDNWQEVYDLELSGRTRITGSSLEVTDEDGNVIVVFKDGHIETKHFNSLNTVGKGNESRGQFSIIDENGNAVVIFKDGHIRTKNFNSADIPFGLNDLPYPFLDKFKGKTLGIIGDSISTFQGWLPSDIPDYDGSTYAVYYPHGTLTMVQQTWWYKVAMQLGISPEHISNCSWSGSRVSGDSTSTTSAGAACSTRRISDLTLRGFTPDIIICFISCNDWGNTPNVPIGTWKVTDPIPSEGTITEMRAAYAL